MHDPVVPLSDIERVAQIAPEMPARQVAEMMRWIAELRPAQHVALAPVPMPEVTDYRGPGPSSIVDVKVLVDQVFAELDGSVPAPAAPEPETPTDRTGQPWTDEDKTIAVELWHQGKTAREIAARLNRPVPATQNMLARLHARRRKPGKPQKTAAAAPDRAPQSAPAPAPAPKVQSVADARGFPETITPVTPPDPAKAPRPPHLAVVPTNAQRELMARIMRLEDDFTPQDDLYLVEAIVGRTPLDVIADQLGCDIAAVKARWQALLGFDPKLRKGGVPLDLQADLVVVLRQLAGEVAA